MTLVICPSGRTRACLIVIGAISTAGLLYMATLPWFPSGAPLSLPFKTAFTIAFAMGAAGMVSFVAWNLSVRAELSVTEIVRRSLFGVQSLPLAQITSASFSSARGEVFLTVRASKRRMMFSTYSFSRAQLQQIQDFVGKQAANSSPFGRSAFPPKAPKQPTQPTTISFLLVAVAFAAIVFLGVGQVQRRHDLAACQPGLASTPIAPSADAPNCH
jgi:hypothetical protein